MSNTILYMATNTVNGHRYIGISRRDLDLRKMRHIHAAKSGRGAIIGAAIRKYGADNLFFRILAVCPDWDYAKSMEIAAIAAFKPEYNVTKGGDGAVGYKHTEQHKKRVGLLHKGQKYWVGRRHKDDTRKKMSEKRLAYWASRPHSRKPIVRKPPTLINKRNRAVIAVDSGLTFPTINAAAEWAGCDRRIVRLACQGVYGLAKGHRFAYLTNNSNGLE